MSTESKRRWRERNPERSRGAERQRAEYRRSAYRPIPDSTTVSGFRYVKYPSSDSYKVLDRHEAVAHYERRGARMHGNDKANLLEAKVGEGS